MSDRAYSAPRFRRSALLLFLFGLAAPVIGAAQEGVTVVTLDEAIALALEHDPSYVQADRSAYSARAQLRQAQLSWLPSVNVSSAYGNSSNERFDQTTGRLVSENYSAQLSASYEIFSGGRRFAEQSSASATLRAAEARRSARWFETVLATKRTFYAAAAAAELVESAKQRLARAQRQLEFAETRLELGTATRSDVLRADLEVGNAELALLEAEAALHNARLELGRRTGEGREVQPAAGALPNVAPPLPPAEELAREAERGSPAALAAGADWRARAALVRASYGNYLPSVRLTGGYDWASFEFPPKDRSWSLRVIATLPIFNGWQREASVAQARAQEEIARASAADAAIGARVSAESAAREIETAEHRVRIAERAVELAREDLRVQEERYQIGNATILDLQASQVALTEAEIEWVSARQELGISVARLEAVLGRALER